MKKEKMKKIRRENPYYRLVDDLAEGRLSLSMVQTAIKESIRRNPKIPEGVKNLVATYGDKGQCMVDRCFNIIKCSVGEMELSYRRGQQAGWEDTTKESK